MTCIRQLTPVWDIQAPTEVTSQSLRLGILSSFAVSHIWESSWWWWWWFLHKERQQCLMMTMLIFVVLYSKGGAFSFTVRNSLIPTRWCAVSPARIRNRKQNLCKHFINHQCREKSKQVTTLIYMWHDLWITLQQTAKNLWHGRYRGFLFRSSAHLRWCPHAGARSYNRLHLGIMLLCQHI